MIHEVGGARMGSDPGKSVLNARNQCWDATNVFVTDGSSFVSNGTCGPALTIMALTTRALNSSPASMGKHRAFELSLAFGLSALGSQVNVSFEQL